MTYSVVLEEGAKGGFMAWVIELPGCYAMAATRQEIEGKLPGEIRRFLGQHDPAAADGEIGFRIVSSEATKEDTADGGTSVLLDADREPLSEDGWRALEAWLDTSREELLEFLQEIPDAPMDWTPEGSPRSLRQNLFHLAFVELMYAVWTFDLYSGPGLEEFLSWTRRVAAERMRELASRSDSAVTLADWSGAPELEEWTARKAARRLMWHERLHLRSMKRRFRRAQGEAGSADRAE